MNYRHAPTPRSSTEVSLEDNGDMNGSQSLVSPYEGENATGALESCCICMEDFENGGPEASCVADMERGHCQGDDSLIVVLPCKSHFFHLQCISTWIHK